MLEKKSREYENLPSGYFYFNHIRFVANDALLHPSTKVPELEMYDDDYDSGGFYIAAGERFRGTGNIQKLLQGIGTRVREGRHSLLLHGIDLDKAVQGDPDVRVVAKFIKPDLLNSAEREKMLGNFLREARITATLDHPHIVKFIDFAGEQVNGVNIPGYIMEHLKRLPEGLSLNDVALLVPQIAQALSYAHSVGVVHQDVQEGNIRVRAHTKEFVLTDFELAHSDSLYYDERGSTEFFIPYADPQQTVEDSGIFRERADIHAFGAMVYNLISKRKNPFGANGHIHLRQKMEPIIQPILPPHQLEKIQEILTIATSFDRIDRFETCIEFAEQLTPLLTSGKEVLDNCPLS